VSWLSRGWPAAFAAIFLTGALWDGPRTGLVLALALALPAALAHSGAKAAGLASALGLVMAGLVQPLIFSPQNLLLIPVCGLLGLATRVEGLRRYVTWGVILGCLAAVPGPQRVWAPALGLGLVASLRPLPRGERALRGLAVLLAFAGGIRTVDAGFVTAENGSPRALWADPIGPVAPGTSRSGWTWGRPVTWRLREGGLSFSSPPAGPTMRRSDLSPVDLAELGISVDCEALLIAGLRGDRRARVQHRVGCDTTLSHNDASDVYTDAVSIVAGLDPSSGLALHHEEPDIPLDEPGAVLLHARLRQGDTLLIGERLALGTSYEQALILDRLEADDRELLASWLSKKSRSLPESLRGPWQRAQELLARD
jgi:hypothetical protein